MEKIKPVIPKLNPIVDFNSFFNNKIIVEKKKMVSDFKTFKQNIDDILIKLAETYGGLDFKTLQNKIVGQSKEGVSLDDVLFSNIKNIVDNGIKDKTLGINGDVETLVNAVIKKIKEMNKEK